MNSRNAFNNKLHNKVDNVKSQRRLPTVDPHLENSCEVSGILSEASIDKNDNLDPFIDIDVKSVMSGVPDLKYRVPPSCRVRDLKNAIWDQCEIFPEKQVLTFDDQELKSDDASIGSYGLKGTCTIILNIKMSAGLPLKNPNYKLSNLLLFLPHVITDMDISQTRCKVKKMYPNVAANKAPVVSLDEKNQKEVELTRERMKNLLRKKKGRSIRSDGNNNESMTNTSSFTSTDITLSPSSPMQSIENFTVQSANFENMKIEEKELKQFFDVAENVEQLELRTQKMYMLPQDAEELKQMRQKFEESAKQRCKHCGKKLSPTEQNMRCRCQKYFCKNHQAPRQHFCPIDYKQSYRTKLVKENPRARGS